MLALDRDDTMYKPAPGGVPLGVEELVPGMGVDLNRSVVGPLGVRIVGGNRLPYLVIRLPLVLPSHNQLLHVLELPLRRGGVRSSLVAILIPTIVFGGHVVQNVMVAFLEHSIVEWSNFHFLVVGIGF